MLLARGRKKQERQACVSVAFFILSRIVLTAFSGCMALFYLKWTLVILHIITAAAWFGLGLRITGQARAVVEAGPNAGGALADATGRSIGLMNVFAALTFVLGLAALFAGGGFGVYGWPYHTSITLVLLLVGAQFVLIRGSWKKLTAVLGSDRDAAQSAAKRLAAGTGIGHLLWLITLVLMYMRHMGLS